MDNIESSWIDDATKSIKENINKIEKQVVLNSEEIEFKTKKHYLDITEFGAIGDAIFYDAITNKYYADIEFTKIPTPFSAVLNSILLLAQTQGKYVYIPSGTYLIDREITLRNNVKIIGDIGKTTLILSDTFSHTDDYVFQNESFFSSTKLDNIVLEDINIICEGHVLPTFTDATGGLEGIIFKFQRISSCNISRCSIKILNKGAKIKATCIWIRGNCSNISIYNSYLENTSMASVGGCFWISSYTGINTNINFFNNTIIKYGQDEAIAVWGNTSNSYIDIYNNNFIYTSDVKNVRCDKLITVFTSDIGNFNNIIIKNNNITLYGNVGYIFEVSPQKGIFSGILFEGNIIEDNVGDSTSNILLAVLSVGNLQLTEIETTYEEAYSRCDIIFKNNIYTNKTKYGRRCFATVSKSILKLYNNIVRSKFTYAIIFEESGNSKIISLANLYNYKCEQKYLSNFSEIRGSETVTSFDNDLIEYSGALYLKVGGSKSTNNTNVSFKNCTISGGWALIICQQAGSSKSNILFVNNIFEKSFQLFYCDSPYPITIGTINLVNNIFFDTILTSLNYTSLNASDVLSNIILNLNNNKYSNGDTENTTTINPSNIGVFKLLKTGKKILNLGEGNNVGWIKKADGSWSIY